MGISEVPLGLQVIAIQALLDHFFCHNGMLVPVRTSFNLRWRRETTYNVST